MAAVQPIAPKNGCLELVEALKSEVALVWIIHSMAPLRRDAGGTHRVNWARIMLAVEAVLGNLNRRVRGRLSAFKSIEIESLEACFKVD